MAIRKKIEFKTGNRAMISLTEDVNKIVAESQVESGVCLVYTPHTTGGITITSFWDPNGLEDIQDEICRLIPSGRRVASFFLRPFRSSAEQWAQPIGRDPGNAGGENIESYPALPRCRSCTS